MRAMNKFLGTTLVLAGFALATPGLQAQDYEDEYTWDDYRHAQDPWETANRKVFVFNETLDRWVLKPTTKGYRKVMPQPVRTGIRNVFFNLAEPRNLVNNLLQGKFTDAGVDFSRFMFNSSFGVLGIFDVASKMGLERNDEDFGQTLGAWGVASGPYVMLPLLGASTLRDAPALVPDWYLSAYRYVDEDTGVYVAGVLQALDKRDALMDAEKLIVGDRYSFIRNAYLSNREYNVRDGDVEDEF